MRYLLMFAIRIYWRIPTKLHQKCLFKETCSHYVYRIAKHQGFIAALAALKERNDLCRPGYIVYKSMGTYYLKTAGGKIFTEESISRHILPPHNNTYLDFDTMNYEQYKSAGQRSGDDAN